MRLSPRDDLHAENNDERSECPRDIEQCLGRSNSHSTGEGYTIAATLLQEWL